MICPWIGWLIFKVSCIYLNSHISFEPHFTLTKPLSSGPAPAIHNLTFELYSEASADFGGLRPVATTSLLHLGTWMMKKREVRFLGMGEAWAQRDEEVEKLKGF